jgi:acetolactate synthase-1/2/3 large subunit
MNVSDLVVKFIEKIGVHKVFLLSGGGIMYLLDALEKSEELGYVCNYHEQACAIAADGYSRINGFGVCFVTFGPGASNALSGIVGAWYDSIPLLVVSGQVRSNLIADYSRVRQVGPQEGNIIEMVRPVTKYAVSLRDPNQIMYELEKAYAIAKSGRPGPVWLELPLDMQSAEVNIENLIRWTENNTNKTQDCTKEVEEIIALLRSAVRPVLVLGNGVWLSGMHDEVLRVVDNLKIPVIVPYTGKDLIDASSEFCFGVFGTAGQRHANFILQNSDLLIGFGVGFCVAKTGFETAKFAPSAKKIFIDIDEGQLHAHPLKADIAIQKDLRDLVPLLLKLSCDYESSHNSWLNLCKVWKNKYPTLLKVDPKDSDYINSYYFVDMLSKMSAEGDVIVTGNGLDCVSFYQGFNVKKGQRSILNGNWGSMGWDLPMAVGASYASGNRVLCITGDGGIMLNIQELLTIGSNKLNIKVFVFNNDGYGSIKSTQDNLFESRYVGANPQSGVSNPNFELIASAFSLPFFRVCSEFKLESVIADVLATEGPVLCEVMISPNQWISPKASSFRNDKGNMESKPLDDMYPFLDAEEIEHNRMLAAELTHI